MKEQAVTVEARVETLVKESQGVFLNGSTHLDIAKEIIQKFAEAKQTVEEVKHNFGNFVSKA